MPKYAKYAKYAKYSLIDEIFSNMQKKLFSVNSMFNESSTFLTPIRLHILSNDMLKHINPDSNYNYTYFYYV